MLNTYSRHGMHLNFGSQNDFRPNGWLEVVSATSSVLCSKHDLFEVSLCHKSLLNMPPDGSYQYGFYTFWTLGAVF